MGGVLVKLRYGVEHRQAGAGSTLRVVVVGLGIAEVCHYTVTKVLRDTPAKALDGLRCRTMVLADDLAPLFGIEMASYLSRADKIAEQYRQMPPLAGWRPSLASDFARIGVAASSGAAHCAQNLASDGFSKPHF